MEFGRFGCGRTLLAFSLVLFCGSKFHARAQQSPTASPVENTIPALPAAKPISEAAAGTVPDNTSSAKPLSKDPSTASVSPSIDNSSQLRLGAGDLLEVGVYNVPELSTKARIGNSGDVYLPLIDYVDVADLSVEEAQSLIQKRLEDGGFVRNPHVTIFVDESASQGVTILGAGQAFIQPLGNASCTT